MRRAGHLGAASIRIDFDRSDERKELAASRAEGLAEESPLLPRYGLPIHPALCSRGPVRAGRHSLRLPRPGGVLSASGRWIAVMAHSAADTVRWPRLRLVSHQ